MKPPKDAVHADCLFRENMGLATHIALQFVRRYPEHDLDHLIQEARIALWRAANTSDIRLRQGFGAYAIKAINCSLTNFLRNKPASLQTGRHSTMDFDRRKVRMDAEVRKKEDQYRTVGTIIEEQMGKAQLQASQPTINEFNRVLDLYEAIDTAPELNPTERKVLRLRFVASLDPKQTARKLRIKKYAVIIHTSRAVMKLRRHFRQKGLRVARGKLKKIEVNR